MPSSAPHWVNFRVTARVSSDKPKKFSSHTCAWQKREIVHRFDLACCTSQDEFRREKHAITRSGQIKVPALPR